MIKKNIKYLPLTLIIFIINFIIVNAHRSEEKIRLTTIDATTFLYISATILIITVLLMQTLLKTQAEKYKKTFFLILTLPIVISTVYLSLDTIYQNINSETQGPVHWHADYKIIICNEELDLIDPKFPNNKIGTPRLHEHNDNKIHIEGTLTNIKEASLGEYFKVIGGKLTQNEIEYSIKEKIISYRNNDICQNTNKEAKLKTYINGKIIKNPENYIIYPDSRVPPGDCIIILFDETETETTDILCESWKVQGWNYETFKRREIKIGDRIWR